MVLSSTIIKIAKINDRVWPRNVTMTDCRPTMHCTVRKGHMIGEVQALSVQYTLKEFKNAKIEIFNIYNF